MRWFFAGLVLLLCMSMPALAGDCGSEKHSKCCADQIKHNATACCDSEQHGCIGIPYVDDGCGKIDPNCCPREDYRLLCCGRSEFRLLCKEKCTRCKTPKRCKQDTCTSCAKHDDDDEGFEL